VRNWKIIFKIFTFKFSIKALKRICKVEATTGVDYEIIKEGA
jgi:hypothetical protein